MAQALLDRKLLASSQGLIRVAAWLSRTHEFTLVLWRPLVNCQLGREASGIVQGGSISWRLGEGS
ncbi:DUF3363 domain-containing protein [Microvirga puerhi]|uniref:DUF3363 domain-containing protein n=1 Tax=Microvirga puerhi TaxID=2876078 RepID=UPI003F7180B0